MNTESEFIQGYLAETQSQRPFQAIKPLRTVVRPGRAEHHQSGPRSRTLELVALDETLVSIDRNAVWESVEPLTASELAHRARERMPALYELGVIYGAIGVRRMPLTPDYIYPEIEDDIRFFPRDVLRQGFYDRFGARTASDLWLDADSQRKHGYFGIPVEACDQHQIELGEQWAVSDPQAVMYWYWEVWYRRHIAPPRRRVRRK